MSRSRKKSTHPETPLFYAAMAEISRDNPMTEAELQAAIDRMGVEGRLPTRDQWEAFKRLARSADNPPNGWLEQSSGDVPGARPAKAGGADYDGARAIRRRMISTAVSVNRGIGARSRRR